MTHRLMAAEAVAQLDAIDGDDLERAHSQADQILLAHAAPDVRQAYARLEERAKWWAAA